MNIYYDKDADLSLIQGKKVAILGYGSQGHAHALNLKESGVDVCVGLRDGSTSVAKAKNAGLTVLAPADAVKAADLVMVLVPDEHQAQLYTDVIAPKLKQGGALAFAHGFNIHFGAIEPRADLDVIMIAPKGPGHTVRSEYARGAGVPLWLVVADGARSPIRRQLGLDGMIADMHMARELGIVGKNRMVADLAIMRQMHISHDPVAVANAGGTRILDGSAIEGAEFTYGVVVADFQTGWLPAIFFVLWCPAYGTKLVNRIAHANPRMRINHNMRSYPCSGANLHLRTDD